MFFKKSLIATALMVASAAALAAPIVNDNVRPVTFGPGTAGETTLQSVLTSNLGVNALTDQSTAGQFGSATGIPLTTAPTLRLEQTNGAATQIFGMWFGTDDDTSDPTKFYMLDLILGAATGNTAGGVAGVFMDYGTVTVFGSGCGAPTPTINCGTFNNALINPTSFGFYFKSGNETAFSIDNLSDYGPNEQTRFLAYNDDDTNWIFGFEDGKDYDYNDMVVKVESIQEVPEPGTLALLGAGLIGLAALRRRKA